jgi:hypothetical protein
MRAGHWPIVGSPGDFSRIGELRHYVRAESRDLSSRFD